MKEHEEWLDRAESDLRFAQVGMREDFYTHVCFLCQQTVEKALKGYLIFKARKYPRIHLLLDLLMLCMQHDYDFQQFRPYCNVLEQY